MVFTHKQNFKLFDKNFLLVFAIWTCKEQRDEITLHCPPPCVASEGEASCKNWCEGIFLIFWSEPFYRITVIGACEASGKKSGNKEGDHGLDVHKMAAFSTPRQVKKVDRIFKADLAIRGSWK
ncbi:hypothetical protein SETIT_7G266700v2 [Setaria italica]|uniref:Uncharacterized protein n=1 Tax=Setaria italica TaxID=4555 RepID=A0A368RZY3_SETIT|nr:hypothetical protein SETIT_7G266700v2 [Setaria italica]